MDVLFILDDRKILKLPMWIRHVAMELGITSLQSLQEDIFELSFFKIFSVPKAFWGFAWFSQKKEFKLSRFCFLLGNFSQHKLSSLFPKSFRPDLYRHPTNIISICLLTANFLISSWNFTISYISHKLWNFIWVKLF